MKKLLLVTAAMLAAGAVYAASAWTTVYSTPSLPEQLCFKNDPAGGYVPVIMVFEADPSAEAAADGAKPVRWIEKGRIPNAAALAAYNAVQVLAQDERPPAFPQPRTIIDAGPEP